MTRFYYDLSELFLAGQKFKYYGISRTVMEVGYELARSDADVGFVVFSPAHGHFFEVYPRLGSASPNGVLDPGLPAEATPKRMRLSFPKRNNLRDALYPVILSAVRRVNQRRWEAVPDGAARPVDLEGQTLVSLGRPKIMADYLMALERVHQRPRFIPLLHDMIPLHELAEARQSLFSSNFVHDNHNVIRRSAALLTNSKFTQVEVERFARDGLLPALPPVTAVPLAHELRPTDEPISKRGPEAPYLLCVGTLTGRKNLECVLGAMMHLAGQGRFVPHLVLAGARRKRAEQYIDRSEFKAIRDRIHQVLNPNQAELRQLYERALALVIPSRMEGWGLPLGEALWLGTPGLAATTPALQEVGSELALYFDPDRPAELAGYVDSLQADGVFASGHRTKLKEGRKKLRSWADVARDISVAVSA
jgi:glycosyltransferase involved in cell wall biosynthesis